MDTFITADTHYSHPDILFYNNRPWLREGDATSKKWKSAKIKNERTEEMNQGLIDRWNTVVGKKDKVYILGDFAYKQHGKWLNALNGKKILIVGNHDSMSHEVMQQFTAVYGKEKGAAGILTKRMNGYLITMSHYPMMSWDNMCNGAWHFHGHTHHRIGNKSIEAVDRYGLMIDVGVDGWDYYPVPLHILINVMRKKEERLNTARKES